MTRAASVAAASAALLVACGGGSSNDGTAVQVSGLYEGTGGSGRASEFLILDDGRYYLVYGLASASATPVGGVVVGDGALSGNSFVSANAHDIDFSARAVRTGTLSAALVPRVSASTSVVHSDGSSVSFTQGFDAASTAGATSAALAGAYAGELVGLGGTLASALNIDATGALAGTTTSGACSYFGLARPHGSGNVYDVSLTFQAGCPAAGTTLHGHAFLRGKLLDAVTVTGDLSSALVFSGVKP